MVNRWVVRSAHQGRGFKAFDLGCSSIVNILSVKCLFSKMPNLMPSMVVFVKES